MSKQDDKANTRKNPGAERLAKLTTAGILAVSAVNMLACGGIAPAPKGRLVRVNGEARTAGVRRGGGWSDGVRPDLGGMTPRERWLAGQGWLASAQLEHAAVGAFADVSRRLLVLGAPSDLVERSHRAALDEIRHARRCFALASAYLGEEHTAEPFTALSRVDAPTGDDALVRLAVGSLRDGALGEGVAALTAAESAARAVDLTVASTLRTIAAEEAEHALLGLDIVLWALTVGGADVHRAVHAELAVLHTRVTPSLPPVDGVSAERLAELGLLPQHELGRIAEQMVAWIRGLLARSAQPRDGEPHTQHHDAQLDARHPLVA